MTGKAPLAWRFGIASLSLLAAVAVYSFARFHPPEILESFQATYPILAEQISGGLTSVLPGSGWEVIRLYWTRGVFDPLDLLATMLGGYIALVLLSHVPTENTDANTS